MSSTKTIQTTMLIMKTNQIRKVNPVCTLTLPLVRVQSATALHDLTVGVFHLHRRHLVQSAVFRLFPVLRDVANIRSWKCHHLSSELITGAQRYHRI